MRRFTVAATQVDTRFLDVDRNLEVHVRLIAETASAGCDLVVFPEGSVTGSNGSPDVVRFAEPCDGRIYRVLQAEAARRGIVVSYGFCELHRGTHYNTSALVGPDGAEFARGLSNYSSADISRIKGLRTDQIAGVLGHCPYTEIIHRDNLALSV